MHGVLGCLTDRFLLDRSRVVTHGVPCMCSRPREDYMLLPNPLFMRIKVGSTLPAVNLPFNAGATMQNSCGGVR